MKMNRLMTPALVLREYDIEGRKITTSLINEMREKFEQLEIDGVHPWRMLIDEVVLESEIKELEDKKARKIARDRVWIAQACAEVMLQKTEERTYFDQLNWIKRLKSLDTPRDFLSFFDLIGIDNEKWRSSVWMAYNSKLSFEEGGIELNLNGLKSYLMKRFKTYKHFLAWMDGSDTPDLTYRETVASWKKPEDALTYFKTIQIPEEKWRSSNWLQRLSKLPKEKGGISMSLSGLDAAIRITFGNHRKFVSWIDDKHELELYFTEIVPRWICPRDALDYFNELCIPDEKWRSSSWLSQIAKLPIEEGGISTQLGGLSLAINARFTGHREFVAWMDGKESKQLSDREIVNSWQTPKDALKFFQSFNIPDQRWRSTEYLRKIAKLTIEDGGINRPMSGIVIGIHKKFGGHREFLAWIDGIQEVPKTIIQIVEEWKDPSCALMYFHNIGIPGEKWRLSMWLGKTSKLSIDKGGIGKSCAGVKSALIKRFGSFKDFIAWMDGKESRSLTGVEVVNSWKKPEDALQYFQDIGVKNQLWKNSSWIAKKAKLPVSQGGINMPLNGVGIAIRNRFGGHKQFVAWVDQKEIELPLTEVVGLWKSPNDALDYFDSLDIPKDKWRKSSWLLINGKISKQEGGIGKNMSSIVSSLVRRFKGYRIFVAAMDNRLPFNGFSSLQEVQLYIKKEIIHLRESGKWTQKLSDESISKEEIDIFLTQEWVRKNPVARAVVDYLNSLSEDE